MKKRSILLIAIGIIMSICVSVGITTLTASADTSTIEYKMGDANLDGTVNTRDVVLIKQSIVGIAELTEQQKVFADTYADGVVNTRDVVLIQQYIVGMDVDLGEAHQHTYSEEWTYDEEYHWHAATCEHDVVADKNAHDFETEITAVTCTTDGYTTYTCKNCGYSFTDNVINATGHNPNGSVEENRTEPTCTDNGSYNSVVYCSVCDEELSRETIIINAKEHNYQFDSFAWNGYNAQAKYVCLNDSTHVEYYNAAITSEITKEPTYTATGERTYTAQYEGHVDTKTEVVSMLGHDYQFSEFVWTGYTAQAKYVDVKNNDYVEYHDATITSEIIEEPTCLGAGTKEYTATYDGHTDTKVETLLALGHDKVYHDDKSATCTEKGWKAYETCSRCDYTTYEEIKALGHTHGEPTEIGREEPTCTKDGGYYRVVRCSVCGDYLTTEFVELAALGHNYNAVITKPTCTEQGYTTYTCTRCGDSYVADNVSAKGHTYSEEWTYNEENHWQCCLNCDEIRYIGEHVWDDYTIIDEATYDSEGEIEFTCSVCGEKKTAILDKLKYVLVFMDYDGSIIYMVDVDEGTSFNKIKPENPTREHYEFIGWDNEPDWYDEDEKKILSDMTLTALYQIEQVEVAFKLPDGNLIGAKGKVDYGGTVDAPTPSEYIYDADNKAIISPELPLYYLTGGKILSFSGWDKALNNITEQTVITAEYENVCDIPILLLEYKNGNKTLSIYIQNSQKYQLYAFEFVIDYTIEVGNIILENANANSAVNWLKDDTTDLYSNYINNKINEYSFMWSARNNVVKSNNLDQFMDIDVGLSNNSYLIINSMDFKITTVSAIVSYDNGETFERVTPSVIYG